MKKIFLIGDSICYGFGSGENRHNGYGHYVEEKLKDRAVICRPNDNCSFMQYTLRYMHEWAAQRGGGEDIDVLHWNNGLWDVLRLLGDEPLTSPEMYKELLVKTHRRARAVFPNAKIIFALSTPVTESMARPDFFRRNEDIVLYNKLAVEILEPLGVTINDLHTAASAIRATHYADWVHYNEEGSSILADHVIKAIESVISL